MHQNSQNYDGKEKKRPTVHLHDFLAKTRHTWKKFSAINAIATNMFPFLYMLKKVDNEFVQKSAN